MATATQETRDERPVAAIRRPVLTDDPARAGAHPDGPATPAVLAIAKQLLAVELPPSAASVKREPEAERVTAAPRPQAQASTVTLTDEVVVRAMAVGQPAFLACFARARRADPTLDASKVQLHIELDETGKVVRVRSDTDAPAFGRCLAWVARGLPFPAPGKPAVVNLPLMFR